jgi:energy-coupling factor transporter ATP-binding protein EcfA2
MSDITIKNVGPITEWAIPHPEEGGVVVLAGRNGSGKSTALEAIRAAIGGKADLSARDGTARGTIEAFGATITVAASTRRRGEADVVSIEGRGDVAALVDPGIADPVAADGARVRAIVAISGRSLSAADFRDLLPDPAEWERLVGEMAAGDPVTLAGKIKRAIEAEARKHGERAAAAMSTAQTLQRENAGIDTTGEHDAAVLAERYAAARVEKDRLVEQAKAHEVASHRKAIAERQLAGVQFSPGDLAAAEERMAKAQLMLRKHSDDVDLMRSRLEAAKQALAGAESDLRIASSLHKQAMADLEAVEVRAIHVETLAKTAAEPVPPPVTAEDHQAAAVAVDMAKSAMEAGGRIREALRRKEEIERAHAKASEAARDEQRLRGAARGVDGVLSSVVSACSAALRVDDGRIVTDTARGQTLYADLSHGERWRLAIDFAIRAVGRRGVLVCPQEAWEGLDPANRESVRQQLEGSGVTLYTAACSDGERGTWYARRGLADVAGQDGKDVL